MQAATDTPAGWIALAIQDKTFFVPAGFKFDVALLPEEQRVVHAEDCEWLAQFICACLFNDIEVKNIDLLSYENVALENDNAEN